MNEQNPKSQLRPVHNQADPWATLAIAVIHKAQKDALRGDSEARVWLATVGIHWARLAVRNGDAVIERWLRDHCELGDRS